MKTHLQRSVLGVVALLLVSHAASAQITVKNRAPLLELRGVTFTTSLAPGNFVRYTSEVLTVYRDGWTFFSFLFSDLPTTEPFSARVMEGSSPAAFQTLVQALTANQVGVQSGNCDIGASGNYALELTWYGRVNRINTLKVGRTFAPTPCTDAVKNIFNAVHDYEVTLLR
jgi:hypothetical protein